MRELAMSWPDAFLLLETETKDPPAGLQEKEKTNKNEGNECGGLRVASLRCGVFADRGGRGYILGTGYRVPSTRYQVLGSQRQVGSDRIYREESEQRTN